MRLSKSKERDRMEWNSTKVFPWGQHQNKKCSTKRKLQIYILNKHRCKNSWHTSKSDPEPHQRDHTWSSRIYHRSARVVQHWEMKDSCGSHPWTKKQKPNGLSLDAEKAFDKIEHPWMIKTLHKLSMEGDILQNCKGYLSQATIFQYSMEILARVFMEKKGIKGINIGIEKSNCLWITCFCTWKNLNNPCKCFRIDKPI